MRYVKHPEARDPEESDAVRSRVSAIIDDVRRNGEDAVRRYARELDGDDAIELEVPRETLEAAGDEIAPDLRAAIDFGIEQVRGFAKLQRDTLGDLEVETLPGVVLGHKQIPVASVGAYVPGGRYSLIASAYMSVVPARVAGVGRVVVCTPPRGGAVHPGLLYAAHRAGADAVYAVGGVQALAAMAYGTFADSPPVDMLVGPGNQFVVEAKRQLFGQVGIDLLAGPTEIGILADETADPFVIACDLVGQAEHDPVSRAVLITTSPDLAAEVIGQMDAHLKAVPTEAVARQCWENGGEVVVVEDEDELVELSDRYALEHVEVFVREPKRLISRLSCYGSLFVGEETTVAYGDKVCGTNHILPTGRASRFSGGLWVGKFLKTVTYQHMTEQGSLAVAGHCQVEAEAEGMFAHARTAAIRAERYSVSAQR